MTPSMKLVFYTTDSIIKKFYSTLELDGVEICSSSKEIIALFNETDQYMVFLDFDCEELECSSISESLKERKNVHTVLLTGAMEIKEIIDYQNNQSACDAYITKPLTVEILNGVINDFEMASACANDTGESTESPAENVDLTFVGIKKDDLQKKLAEMEVEEEVESTQVNFQAGVMKVASEVREVIDQHNVSNGDFDNDVNKDIQRKFDAVFGVVEHGETSEKSFGIVPEGFDDIEKSESETDGISFELGSEESDEAIIEETIEEIEEESSSEVVMSEDNNSDDGLEFNLPDEETSSEDENGLSFDMDSSNEDDGSTESTDKKAEKSGLEFNLGEEDSDEKIEEELIEGKSEESDTGIDLGAATESGLDLTGEGDNVDSLSAESESDESGIEFGEDSSPALDLSGEEDIASGPETQEQEDEGGLEFGEDSSPGLDLSGEGEIAEAAPAEEQEDEGGLDFGEESSPGLDLSGEGEEVETSQVDDQADEGGLQFDGLDEGGLDLSGEGDEVDNVEAGADSAGDLDFSEPERSQSEDSMSFDESGDVDETINSIISPPEDSTGEFDMSEVENSPAPEQTESAESEDDSMEEFDYKTLSGFTPPAELNSDEEPGEDTNPTIIAQTQTLVEGDEFTGTLEPVAASDNLDEVTSTGTLESDGFDISDIGETTGETVVSTGLNFSSEETKTQAVERQAQRVETPVSNVSDNQAVRSYDEDEMLRLQGTIRQLREEREELMGQMNQLKSEKQLLEQDNLGLKAELDEVKIELGIIKKRSHDDSTELKYQLNLSEDKRDVYETKVKTMQKEFDRLNQKVRIDFNQVKQKEKELESKLELAVMDSESQVQTREMKILELKRKIDSLEFNMENSSIREQKHREDKFKLEERLNKIMKTLRGSIQLIEDDLDVMENDATKDLE